MERTENMGKVTVQSLKKTRDLLKNKMEDQCLSRAITYPENCQYIDKLLGENEKLRKKIDESSERERKLLAIRDGLRKKNMSLNRERDEFENMKN